MAIAIENPNAETPRQNWILSPVWDVLLIIGAPVLWFVWAAAVLVYSDAATVLGIFAACNVAHHFPTFIRIYGDRDLLKRFRWSLLLGPVVPFSLAMVAVAFVVMNNFPVNNVLFLLIIVTIWDPWHFLMQHYGFMRIYDRNNRAPPKLAARMDLAIAGTWFIFVMAATIDWLPNLLYELYCDHRIPVLFLFNGPLYRGFVWFALTAAIVMTLVYIGYLIWCYQRGYYVSKAKIALTVVTLAMVYLTYVPNSLVNGVLPQWDFRLGFAAMGMLHVSQYFAIVWKYNRVLATRREKARPGWFVASFGRGGVIVLSIYVLICLAYGVLLTAKGLEWIVGAGERSGIFASINSMWIIGTLLAINFTSTLMHYYYDGFIWKVRHKENRQNLDLQTADDSSASPSASWWDSTRTGAIRTLAFHSLYFGVPILLLAATMTIVRSNPGRIQPLGTLSNALALVDQGDTQAGKEEAQVALDAIDYQISIEQHMLNLRPRAQHYKYIADLIYSRSITHHKIYAWDRRSRKEMERHHVEIVKTIDALEKALTLPGPYRHREAHHWEALSEDEQRSRIQQDLTRLRAEIGER